MPRPFWPLAATVLLALPCQAQTSPPPRTKPAVPRATVAALSLAQAIVQASAASPELSAARKELAAVQSAREQAGLWQNPQFELLLEGTRQPERETTVAISQLIELGGKRTARTSAADSAVAIARVQLEAQEAELRSSVTAAYFQALIAQERVKFAQAALALGKSAAMATARLVAVGNVSPVDETRRELRSLRPPSNLPKRKQSRAWLRLHCPCFWGSPPACRSRWMKLGAAKPNPRP